MKMRHSAGVCYFAALVLAAGLVNALAWADDNERDVFDAPILLEYIGQVINGTPTPASSHQFGNLQQVAGVDTSLHFTFDTEATTSRVVANGPIRIADRTGTTTIYLGSAPGDFGNPDSFHSGTPVQASSLRQQVIVDTSTGVFSVINVNTITSAALFVSDGREVQLGEIGQSFQTVLNGHLNVPGMLPTGWFGGYAIRTRH